MSIARTVSQATTLLRRTGPHRGPEFRQPTGRLVRAQDPGIGPGPDPNVFDVTSTDFSVQDRVGHIVDAEGGSARAVLLAPRCRRAGSVAIWQDDVTVRLG